LKFNLEANKKQQNYCNELDGDVPARRRKKQGTLTQTLTVQVAAWNGGVSGCWRTGRDELGFSSLEEEKSLWTRADDG
jgi:hypothetical protein